MYFSGEITLLGKESVEISDNDVYREITCNKADYQLIYSESYVSSEFAREVMLECVTKTEHSILYKDIITKDDIREELSKNNKPVGYWANIIDTDNLAEYCINMINSKSIPAGMSVTEHCPMEISLYGNDDKIQNFTLIPECDGTVFHFNDSLLYCNYVPDDSSPKSRKICELPIFNHNRMISKFIYTNGYLINKDYRDNSIFIVDSKGNQVISQKYEKHSLNLNLFENYMVTIPYNKLIESSYLDYDRPGARSFPTYHDTFIYHDHIPFIVTDIGKTIGYKEEANYGNDTKEFDIFYPIHYVSILGNIYIDTPDLTIYANQSFITKGNTVVSMETEYHALNKSAINNIKKLIK